MNALRDLFRHVRPSHVAAVAVVGAIVFAVVQLTGEHHVADSKTGAPASVLKQLGPAQPSAGLVHTPNKGLKVSIRKGGFDMSTSEGAVGLVSTTATKGGAWTKHANGATRTTPFGSETVAVTPSGAEQYLTVDSRQGVRTWRWRIDTTYDLRSTPSGYVGFFDGSQMVPLEIKPVQILGGLGRDVTPEGLQWKVVKQSGSWWLELKLNDSKLPLPYTIDPGVFRIASNVGTKTTTGAGNLSAITIPATARVRDVLILHIAQTSTTAIATPAGWTAITGTTGANGTFDVASFYHVVVAGDLSPSLASWSPAVSSRGVGVVDDFRGIDSTSPIQTTGTVLPAATGTANTVQCPSITPAAGTSASQPEHIVCQVAVRATDTAGWNTETVAGYTYRSTGAETGTTAASIATFDRSATSTTTIGTTTSSTLSSTTYWMGTTFGLKDDYTAPTSGSVAIGSPTATAYQASPGSTIYFNGNQSGSFTLSDPIIDSQSSVESVNYPAVATAGWTHPVDLNTTSPNFTSTYAWTYSGTSIAAPTAAERLLTETNGADLTSTQTVAIVQDISTPTGGALTVNGTAASSGGTSSYLTSGTTVAINTRTDYSGDTGSGLASSTLTMATGTLSGGVCSSYGTPATIVGSPAQTVADGHCYLFTLTGADHVGNTSSVSTTVEVDETAPTASFTVVPGTNSAYQYFNAGSSTLYYNPAVTGTFMIDGSGSSDGGSGLAQVIFPGIGTTANTVAATNPVLFWRFSETSGSSVADSSGNANTGVASGTYTRNTTPGAFANDSDPAITFTASGSGKVVGASPTGIPSGTASRSVEAWFKTTTTTQQALTSYGCTTSGGCAAGHNFGFFVLSANQLMTWGWGGGEDLTFSTTPVTSNIADGNWHQAVETYNGTTNSMTVYLDGVSLGSQTPTTALNTVAPGTQGFNVGVAVPVDDASNGGKYFNGSIDDVSVYSGVLSLAQIQAQYNARTLPVGFTGAGSVTTGSPWQSAVHTFTSSATTAPAAETVTAVDGVGNKNSTTLNFAVDQTAPTGGAFTANGVAASTGGTSSYLTSGTTLAINSRTDYTDAGSGLLSSTLTMATGTLSGNSCSGYGAPATITGTTSQTVISGNCYLLTLTGTDNVDNVATPLSTVVMVDTTAPSAPTGFSFSALSGSAYWPGSGSTVYFKGGTSGGFTATASGSSDSETGIASYNYGAIAGSGWAGTGTYTYTTASPTGTGAVTATNGAGTTGTATSFTAQADSTAPSGGTLTIGAYSSSLSVSPNVTALYAESASPTASGLLAPGGNTLTRTQGAPTAPGSCAGTTFGSPATINANITATGAISDTVPLDGECYQYTLTGTDNVGNQATTTATVLVDTTAPSAPTLSFSSFTNAYATGTTVYFKGGAAGGFTVTPTSTDSQSGIANYTFPGLGGGAWSQTNGVYTFTSAATTQTGSVTATNNAGLTGSGTNLTAQIDSTAPTGGVLTINGQSATGGGTTSYLTSGTSLPITTRTDYNADTGSGLLSSTLTMATGTLSGDSCSGYGAPATIVGSPTQTVASGHCYQFVLTGLDRVGNSASITTTVMVDTTAPTAPTGFSFSALSGSAYWPGSGSIIYFKGATTGGFTATASGSTDSETGIASYNYGAIAGSGWAGTGTYTYTTASPTGTGAVTATNDAGTTGTSTNFTAQADTTAPTSGVLTINGQGATGGGTSSYLASGTSLPITTRTDYTETQTGTASGLATSTLTMATGTLSGNSCSGYGAPATIVGSPTQTVASGNCYQFVLTGTDNVGNSTSITTTVMVDTTAPTAPTGFSFSALSGSAYWPGSGSIIYFKGATTGGFTATASGSSDSETGIASYNYGAIAGSGWAGTGTYTYTTASPTGTGAVTATNDAGTTGTSTNFTAQADTTAPTSGVLTIGAYSSTLTVSPNVTALYAETQTPTASGLLASGGNALTRTQGAPSSPGSCAGTSFGSPATINANITATGAISDTVPLDGECYQYTLTGTDNVGNTATTTATTLVDTTAPSTPSLSFGSFSNAYATGTTVYFKGSATGGFTVTPTSTDSQSGIANYTFPGLGGGAWSQTNGVYTFTSAATTQTGSVTATNNAGLTGSGTNLTAQIDSTAPTGGTISVPGFSATLNNITITTTDYADTGGSGIASNVITRSNPQAPSSPGVCPATGYTGATTITSPDTVPSDGQCYVYTLTGTDNVGNTASVASSPILVDTTVPSAPALAFGSFSNAYASGTTVYFKGGAAGGFTVTPTSTDSESGIASYSYPGLGGGAWSQTNGVYTFTSAATTQTGSVTATNGAGTTGAGTSFTAQIDSAAPTSTITCNGSGCSGWYTSSPVSVAIAGGGESGASGVRRIVYTTDGSTPAIDGTDTVTNGTEVTGANASFNVTAEGTTTVKWIVEDNVGNVSGVGTQSVQLDTVHPTVTNVTSSPLTYAYKAGQTVPITVSLSEPVDVNTSGGTPTLALSNGATASYASGSGGVNLTFDYTVGGGDTNTTHLAYTATNSLVLNGGTIDDVAGNSATLTLAAVGAAGSLDANTTLTIDTVSPTVSSVTATNADGAYKAGQTIHVQVNFSEPVTVTGTPQLTLETGTTDETLNYTSGSTTSTLTFDYVVQPGDTSVDLDYHDTGALTLNGGSIADAATNNATLALATPGAAGSLGASKNIAIDTTAPTVSSVSASNPNGTYPAGQTIHVQVNFSEPVTVTGTPQLLLETGTTDQTAGYASGSGSSTLVFDYTIQAGDTSADLDYHDTGALTLNGGSIADAAANDATLTLATPGAAGSLGANKDIVVDTTAPTVNGVTASNPDGAYKNGQTIHVQVDFTEPVDVTGTPQLALNTSPAESAAYISGTGTSTLTFDYTVQAGDNVTLLDYTGTGALTLNGGTIRDAAANDATLTLAAPAAAGSLSYSKNIAVDTTAPTVSGVSSSNADGAYGAGQTIHVQVNFSEPVDVTGSPKLALNTTPAESAVYASGSGSSTLVFDYTVQTGDNAATLDYTATNALTLNGGSISDPAANAATLTLASPGGAGSLAAGKSITIDTTAPAVTSVSASNANGSYGAGQTIHVQVTFGEPVTVSGVPTLSLNTTPAESAAYTSGSGTSTLVFDYTVQAGDNVATLDYTGASALSLNGGTIRDASLNDATLTLATPGAAGSLSANRSLTIDTTAPTVSTVTSSTPNGAYRAGQTIHVQVVFAEPVNVTGTPQLLLETGSTDQTASYVSGSGSATLVFDYTVQPGDTSADLDYHGTGALTLNGGTIADPAGNNATLTLATPGTAGSLSANDDLVVDTTAPTVTGVTASNANGAYKAGQTIHIQVNFSEPVDVTGSPQLALDTTPGESATYQSGTGTSTLAFDYTVQPGDNVTTLDYAATNSLTLSGGAIADPAGNNATLTLATPGAAGSLSNSKSLTIDTTAPAVSGVTASNANGAYKASQTIHVQVDFSEPVTVTGTPQLALNTTPGESAAYASGSGSSTLDFDYVVQTGDTAATLDYAATNSLSLSGGTIADPAGNDATLTLASPGAAGSLSNSKSITIDSTAPTVSGVTSSNANGAYKAGQTIHVQVDFSEPVTVSGSPQLALNTTPGESAAYQSGSGTSTLVFDYTVQTGDNVATLDYAATNALTLNGGTIRDAATNDATLTLATPGGAGSLSANKSLTVDTTAPTVSSVTSSTPNGAYNAGQTIHVQVVFAEPVNVTGTPQLLLETGSTDQTATYNSGSGSSTLVFDYTVQPGDTSSDLDYHDTGALTLNGGSISDPAGNNAALTLFTPGAAGSLGANKDLVIDTTAPTVTGVTASNADGAYRAGQTIHVQVNFSEPVDVTGSPQLGLDTTPGESATYQSGTGTSTLTLDYTVQPGDNVTTLDYVATNSLTLNGGTIADAAANAATLTLASPGAAGSLSNSKTIAIDTVTPTVSSRSVDGTTLDVIYSEPLDAGSAPAGSDFTVSVNGSGDAVDAAAFAGGNTIVRLTLHDPVHFLDTVTVAYTGSAIQDPAGNVAATYTAQPVTDNTADAAPNTVTLNSPSDGAFVNSTTPTLTATFSDPDANDTGTINFELCTASDCTAAGDPFSTFDSPTGIVNGSSGSASVPGGAGLASGSTYYWRAKATDSNSTQSAAYSSIRSFTVDTGAPTAAYSLVNVTTVGGLPVAYYPGSGSTIYYNGSAGSGAKSFTVEAAVSDAISGGASVTTQNFNGGLSNLTHTDGTTTTPGSGLFDTNTFTYTAPTSHDAAVDVLSHDVAGNPSTTTSFLIHNDTVAPTASIGFPSTSAYDTAGWTGTLSGTSTDADAGVHAVLVAIHDNTTNTDYDGTNFGAGGQQYLTAIGTTSWTYPLAATKLTDGHSYTITVETIDNVGNTDTAAASQTFTYDTTPPAVSGVSASNPNGAYDAGSTIHVQVDFTEPVNVTGSPQLALNTSPAESATYTSGSGTSNLVFDYVVQPGDNAATLDYAATNALTLGGGTIADAAGNTATLTLASPGAAGSLATNKSLTIDTVHPAVNSVSASNASGSYNAGQTIHVQVNFSEPVTVTGSPKLALNTSPAESATYASGSGTSTLVFDYTVQTGDNAATLDYAATTSLTLNGGTIADPAGNDALLTLAAPGSAGSLSDTTSLTIDTTAPTVSSVTASNSNGSYDAGQTIHVQLNFSEPVTVTGSPKLALNTTPAESATYASGSGTSTLVFDYTVQTGDTAATLDYTGTAALTLNGGTIVDPAGNDATLTLAAPGASGSLSNSKSLTIDTSAPTVSGVTASNADGAYKAGQTIHVQVNFDEPVTVSGSPQLALNTSPGEAAVYASGSGTATLVFDYTVQAGDTAATLDYTATNALTLNSGTIADLAGNGADLTLATPGASGSLSNSKSLTIDTAAPTVSTVTSSTPNGAYNAGQTIHVLVNFDEPVTVTGIPQLLLETGTTDQTADYASGSGSSTLVFDYTIQPGDTSADLDYHGTAALSLNGGTIADAAANDATLTLATPGTAGSLSANDDLVVDTTAPTASGITASNPNGAYKAGQTIHVQVNFDEPVAVTGSPQLALNTTPGESATYASGSGSSTLVFDYTVQPGDNAPTLDYTATNALTLNSGTIADLAGNGADLTLASPGAAGSLAANKSITIDTNGPTVTNVTSSSSDGSYDAGQTIHVEVTFSEPVNVTGTPQLLLDTGTVDESRRPTPPARAARRSSSTTPSSRATPRPTSTTPAPARSRLNGGTDPGRRRQRRRLSRSPPRAQQARSAPTRTSSIDTTAPTVSDVTASNANGSYTAGETIHVQVNFNEPVDRHRHAAAGAQHHARPSPPIYQSGSGTTTLTFDYTVQAGDTADDLDYAATSALTLNGGTIAGRRRQRRDPHARDSGRGRLARLPARASTIDTTAPTVSNVTSSNANGSYTAGQTIHVHVDFSEPVTVTGTPQLRSTRARPTRPRPTPPARHRDADLRLHRPGRRHRRPTSTTPRTSALTLNGGTIRTPRPTTPPSRSPLRAPPARSAPTRTSSSTPPPRPSPASPPRTRTAPTRPARRSTSRSTSTSPSTVTGTPQLALNTSPAESADLRSPAAAPPR